MPPRVDSVLPARVDMEPAHANVRPVPHQPLIERGAPPALLLSLVRQSMCPCTSSASVFDSLLSPGRHGPEKTSLLNSFCHAHFRAARPRVTIDLCFASRHRLLYQQFVVTLFHSIAERIFDNAVFQRVEADDHQPPARFQYVRGCLQQLPQIVQFMVYEDSECLESSGRRMNPSFRRIHWPGRG